MKHEPVNTNPEVDSNRTATINLNLAVEYDLNGVRPDHLRKHLESACKKAIGAGLLTGETAAEVARFDLDVVDVGSHPSDAEITSYLRDQIEDGLMNADDIPSRMARYGQMAPASFLAEMLERIGD